MRRGTTDCLEFAIPYNASQIANGYVTITQLGTVIKNYAINSENEAIQLEDGVIRIPLSQADTLAFPTGAIRMQIRLLLTNGEAVASSKMETTVDDVEKDGVIE